MRNPLPLVRLGPAVLRHALAGTLPPSTTLDDLLRAVQQLDEQKQAEAPGIAQLSSLIDIPARLYGQYPKLRLTQRNAI